MLGLAPQAGKPAGIRAVVNIFGPSDFGTLTPTAASDASLRESLGKDMNAILKDLLGTSDPKA
jgi:hypothetical protein